MMGREKNKKNKLYKKLNWKLKEVQWSVGWQGMDDTMARSSRVMMKCESHERSYGTGHNKQGVQK